MEFYHGDKIYHFDDLMIYHIYHLLILGLLTKLTNFAFLQIADFGHFDTFPDGWVGGWVNNKYQLSLVGAQVELCLVTLTSNLQKQNFGLLIE